MKSKSTPPVISLTICCAVKGSTTCANITQTTAANTNQNFFHVLIFPEWFDLRKDAALRRSASASLLIVGVLTNPSNFEDEKNFYEFFEAGICIRPSLDPDPDHIVLIGTDGNQVAAGVHHTELAVRVVAPQGCAKGVFARVMDHGTAMGRADRQRIKDRSHTGLESGKHKMGKWKSLARTIILLLRVYQPVERREGKIQNRMAADQVTSSIMKKTDDPFSTRDLPGKKS